MGYNEGFTETALRGFSDVVEQQRLDRLGRSAVIKKWLRFYKEWFGMDLDLKDFQELLPPQRTWAIFVIPKDLTIQACFDLLKKKVGKFECFIENPDQVILKARQKDCSYITYESAPLTVLEVLVYDLFFLFQDKIITTKVLTHPYKSCISHMENKKRIVLWVSIDMPWKKDTKGDYSIPPAYNLKKLEYKVFPI